jgi:predicted metal-dependent phosphoesterase TrpH
VAHRVDPVPGLWRIDMHCHTYVSPDSATDPRELVERAREVGLAKLAVTDHNSIEGALEARALAPDLIIVGQEIDTAVGGELIAYFLTERIPPHLAPEEAIARLRGQGAVISISHPLDRLRGSAMGQDNTLKIIGEVDALEVFNARCLLAADNRRAAALAAQYRKLGTAGSDGHTLPEIGAAYVELPSFRGNSDAFLASLAQGRTAGRLTGVLPHVRSTLAKAAKRRKAL